MVKCNPHPFWEFPLQNSPKVFGNGVLPQKFLNRLLNPLYMRGVGIPPINYFLGVWAITTWLMVKGFSQGSNSPSKWNLLPSPSLLSTFNSLPINLQREAAILNPSPVPPKFLVVLLSACIKDLNIVLILSCGIPIPVSVTEKRILSLLLPSSLGITLNFGHYHYSKPGFPIPFLGPLKTFKFGHLILPKEFLV